MAEQAPRKEGARAPCATLSLYRGGAMHLTRHCADLAWQPAQRKHARALPASIRSATNVLAPGWHASKRCSSCCLLLLARQGNARSGKSKTYRHEAVVADGCPARWGLTRQQDKGASCCHPRQARPSRRRQSNTRAARGPSSSVGTGRGMTVMTLMMIVVISKTIGWWWGSTDATDYPAPWKTRRIASSSLPPLAFEEERVCREQPLERQGDR